MIATATLTSAIIGPAIPMLRRTGTGRATRAISEIATVVPLKTTAEPACCIPLRTASSLSCAHAASYGRDASRLHLAVCAATEEHARSKATARIALPTGLRLKEVSATPVGQP